MTPPRCLSPSPVSSLFRTPSSVNDVNVFRCWREENRSVFSCLGLSEVAGVAFSPSPRLWKSRSHPRRQIFFRSISHPRFALIFRSEPRGSTCTVAGGGEGRAPTGSRGGGVHLWTGKKKNTAEVISAPSFNNIPSPPSHFSSTPAILININK